MSKDSGDEGEVVNNDVLREQQGVLHKVWYDPASDQSLAVTIVQAVATLEEESMDTLHQSPLHESVDIDAVETLLFRPETDLRGSETSTVTFRYRGYQITVRGDGLLRLSE